MVLSFLFPSILAAIFKKTICACHGYTYLTMGLDDFKEKDVDIVPVQELQRDDPPSDYESWSEYEPQPDGWDEDVIWAIGECTDEDLDGDEVFIIAVNDNRSSVLKSTNFVELEKYQ